MKMPRHASSVAIAIIAVVITVIGTAPEVTRALAPPPGTIDTFAGGGLLTSDGIPATSASLTAPYGIAVNSVGDVFFSDLTHCSVRKVSHGLISTAVGTGVCDYRNTYSGDGGPSTGAMLNRPTGLAFDRAGNLYIVDSFNCSIREVDVRTGTITTVAGHGPAGCGGVLGDGGPATQANMFNPIGVAVDGAGSLYIADTGSCRVRKVSNGVISTVAGIGIVNASCTFGGDGGLAVNAGFSPFLTGIAIDGAGNLFIADNSRIREVSRGIINTVAGTSSGVYNGDGPAATATLNGPQLLAVDGAGNLFIADTFNCLVRRLSGGMLTTVAGLGVTLADLHFAMCGFSGDGGPATAAELGWTAGVAVDGGGNLYITDLGDPNVLGRARVRIVYGTTPPASGTTNVAPVLAVPGAQSVQYSDPLSFGVSASDPDGDALVLSAAGLPAGLAFTDNGNGTGRVSGTVLAPAGTYTATFWVSDGSIPPVAAAVSIVVSREDATLTYTGDALVRTGASTRLSASVTQAADGSPGDITKASVLFDLTGLISGATTRYGPVASSAAGQASLTLPAGLPADVYSVTARIDPANGYYTAAASSSTLVVYDPSRSTSGSGWVMDNGAKSDFGFTAKYGPDGNPQGQLEYSFVDGGQTMKVKMASPSWFVAQGRTAVFFGAATVNGASGYGVSVTVVDNGRGSLDTYGVMVSRADGSLLHTLAPILLGGGSLIVQ